MRNPLLELVGNIALYHDELVASQPGRYIASSNHRAQALGCGHEQKVAAVVTKLVVDLLEAVDVDEVHGEAAAAHRQDGKNFLQLLDQVRAVGQLGQRVVMGEEADAPVRLLFRLVPRYHAIAGIVKARPVSRHSDAAAIRNVLENRSRASVWST